MNDLDEKDQEILRNRVELLNQQSGPRVGDYVRFAGEVLRRVSHVWDFGQGPESIQTSHTGSFYLGEGFVSFSGGLCRGVAAEALRLTEEKSPGSVWFFHHNWAQAHNGVQATVDFRVFECDLSAPA